MKTSRTITTARIEYRYRRLRNSGLDKWDVIDRLYNSYGRSAVNYWIGRIGIRELSFRELRAISKGA